jgi:hypothetical protein
LEPDVTVDGGTAALLVVAAAALVVGAAAGIPLAMVAGVAGALLVLFGVVRAPDADPVSRGAGSVALVAAAVLLGRAFWIPDTPSGFLAMVCGSLAVLLVGLGTLPEPGSARVTPALYALIGSTAVVLVGGALGFILVPILVGVPSALVGTVSFGGGWIPNVLLSLLVLQVLVVALSVVIDRADAVLKRWIATGRSGGFPVLDRLGVEAGAIPRALWGFLGLQVLLAALFGGVVTDLLRATPPGQLLYALVTGGVLHVPLVALIVLFAGVVAADAVRRVLMRLAGYHPPTVIGIVAGGLVAVAVVVVAAALALVGVDPPGVLTPAGLDAGVLGSLPLVGGRTATLAIILGAGALISRAPVELADPTHVGVASLLVAVVAGSQAGAHPVVVFVAVGLALGAFEAGIRSRRLTRRLGPGADTRSAELVHLLGSAVAIVVGVGLATATLYVVVPATAGLGDARGVMLLVAGMVGLSAALLLLNRGEAV